MLTEERLQEWDKAPTLDPRVRLLIAEVLRLRQAFEPMTYRPCETSEYHGIEEDGVSRCLDPEYVEMGDLGPGATADDLEPCDSCYARHVLRPQSSEGTHDA